MDLETRKKKLLFRAHHRGFKEADLIIGGFADAYLADMGEEELGLLEELLSAADQDLYGWIVGTKDTPTEITEGPLGKMLDRLRHFGYSERPVTD